MEPQVCPFCHVQLSPSSYFCPNCGKKLKEPPLSTTTGKQISIYALSLFLPPLGLWPGVKYLLQKDQKAKTVGMIAIILTILSTILTIFLTLAFVDQLNQSLNTQLNQYQNLGY